nr:AgmX/PglI C-terminal domain-containing protein [Nannocystis sp. SCPEA4]
MDGTENSTGYSARVSRSILVVLLLLLACRPATTEAPSGQKEQAGCERGDAEACFDHGLTFQFPPSGAPDLARALELYDRSCALGFAPGCTQAVGFLVHGAVPRDDERASEYARRACALKDEDACSKPLDELGGAILKETVRTVVRSNIEQVRDCYNAGLKRDPKLEGRVHVQFVIQPDGSVGELTLVDELADASEVVRCIAEVARGWKFPAPYGRIIVTYPFVLEPSDPG